MSSRYPDDWNKRRREVYTRDEHVCQNCDRVGGEKGDGILQAHHVVPVSKGGVHSKSNLITLCSECHDAIHSDSLAPTHESKRPEKDEEKDFILPDTGPSSIEGSSSSGRGSNDIKKGRDTPRKQAKASQSENPRASHSTQSEKTASATKEDDSDTLEFFVIPALVVGLIVFSTDIGNIWTVLSISLPVSVILVLLKFYV